jgi:hypothetical protein
MHESATSQVLCRSGCLGPLKGRSGNAVCAVSNGMRQESFFLCGVKGNQDAQYDPKFRTSVRCHRALSINSVDAVGFRHPTLAIPIKNLSFGRGHFGVSRFALLWASKRLLTSICLSPDWRARRKDWSGGQLENRNWKRARRSPCYQALIFVHHSPSLRTASF